ncbi:MAG: hypothetical protein ACYCOU_09950 [Sulfobacillus sp.]
MGAYCGYDYNDCLAIIDSLSIPRTGAFFPETVVLNDKNAIAKLLLRAGLKFPYISDSFPQVIKRSDSCGSFDTFVISSISEKKNVLDILSNCKVDCENFVKGKEFSLNFVCMQCTTLYSYFLHDDEVLTREKKEDRKSHLAIEDYNPERHSFVLPIINFVKHFRLRDLTRIDFRMRDGAIHIMDINNVACCNFDLLTDKELKLYADFVSRI